MSWYLEEGPHADVVISTRIRLARNIRHYAFPNLLDPEMAKECYDEVTEALHTANAKMKDECVEYDLADISTPQLQSLVERRLISEDLAQKRQVGRVILSCDESIAILLGEEDHIRIQAMQAGLRLAEAYREAEAIALLLEERLPLAYHEDFGFLTSCPTNVGTGLRASVMLHLPALGRSRGFDRLLSDLRQSGFAVRGPYGERSNPDGYLYQVSNQLTLGSSEAESIEALETAVLFLVKQERKARLKLFEQQRLSLENQIFRAYGILSQARLLTSSELSGLISDMRLGVALGYFPGLVQAKLNRLANESGVGEILAQAGVMKTAEERDEIRAKMARELMIGALLKPDPHASFSAGLNTSDIVSEQDDTQPDAAE